MQRKFEIMHKERFWRSSENLFNSFSVIIIPGFSFLLIVGALLTPSLPMGESDDYMLSTISLENRFSLFILPSDIDQAKSDFPEHMWYWTHYTLYPTGQSGVLHGYYFGTYSLACIPMKMLLKILHFSQTFAFSLTNALLYIFALLVVFFKLRQSNKNIFLTVLLLVCNPAVFYIWWPSAEIFIFSFVVISLVFFSNNEHKKAAFFLSLAGSVQPTIMVFGIVILIDYIFNQQNNDKDRSTISIKNIIKDKLAKILKIGIFFIPAFIPFVYTYAYFKKINLTASAGSFNDYWYRFVSYLFDLNLGLLPYFPICLILFFILFFIGVYKFNFKSFLYIIGFFGVIGAYAINYHINCGMSGIARYNVWVFPIAIFFIVTQYHVIIKSNFGKNIVVILLLISSCVTLFVVKGYGMFRPAVSDQYMTPIAMKVLDSYPSLYCPYPYTFVSRVTHVNGGYNYTEPVIYKSSNGYVRKVLVTSESVALLGKILIGNNEDMKFLKKEIERIQVGKGFYYINFEKSRKVMINFFPNGKQFILPSEPRLQTLVGIRSDNNSLIQTTGKAGYLVYGPYMDLDFGKYKLVARGKLFGHDKSFGSIDVTANSGAKILAIKELLNANNPNDSIIATLDFTLDVHRTNVEFRIFVRDGVFGCFTGYEIRKLDNNMHNIWYTQ